jgi:DNA-binding MarR family transcriptional regulator
MASKRNGNAGAPDALDGLYGSPEFLIRRAHQIATAVFTETCADLDLTPSQYAALFALRERSLVGQNELGRLIALDRSTTSLVVKILRERGLVTATADDSDRRKSFLQLSNEGRLLLARAERRNSQSSRELLAVFEPGQATEFLELLDKFARSLGAVSSPRTGG